MTQPSSAPDQRRGCGPVFVAMIAGFFLVVGVFAGAGGVYYYATETDEGAARLGLTATETVVEPSFDLDEVYALAYPLLETLEVPDSVDEEQMRQHLRQERFVFKECYRQELERSPDTRGELDVQFSISGTSGEVEAALTRGNYTGSEELSDCVLDTIRSEWSFPEPDTTGMAAVRVHILFLPLSNAEA